MRAAPGAAAATVMCTIASLLSLGPWSADTSSTIAVIVTGVISLGMLFTVCTPLNRFRTLLISLLSLAFAAAVLFAGGLFYLTALDGMQKLSLAAMCLGGLLMIFLLSRFVFGKRAEGKSRA